MIHWETFIKEIISRAGFSDWRVEIDEEHKHGTIFIHDNPALIKENLPTLVENFNYLIQLIAKKNEQSAVFFDINNYRREREDLIAELARAAARKVMATKQEVSLPAMNSYERRLVHVALSIHPEVVTESFGVGRERFVVVKLLEEGAARPPQESADRAKSSAETASEA